MYGQDTLTLDQAIATALKNNYDILLARNDSLVAGINYSYRNLALLPQLNASGTIIFNNNSQSQTYSGNIVKSRKGITSNNANAGINATWVLFNGFKMFVSRDRLEKLLTLGSIVAKNQVVNTVSDVIKIYYDIVRQEQLLKNIEEQIALNSDQLKLANYKFELGTGIKPDVLQAEIDLNQQRSAQINQLAAIDQRKQNLALLMNIGQSVSYEVNAGIPVKMDLVLNDILSDLNKTSFSLQIARSNLELAGLALKLAKTEFLPTVGFVSAYNFARINNNSVVNPTIQPLLSTNHGFNYGLTASIPIFNGFGARQQVHLARSSIDYQLLIYNRQQRVVTDSILNVYRTYEAQKKILSLEDSSSAWARENLTIAKERYRLGVTNFIELRLAEQNLQIAETSRITARYNLKLAETEMLRLKGDLIR